MAVSTGRKCGEKLLGLRDMQLDEHRMEVKPKTGAGECRQRVTRTMLQGQEAAPRVTGGLGRPVQKACRFQPGTSSQATTPTKQLSRKQLDCETCGYLRNQMGQSQSLRRQTWAKVKDGGPKV